MAIRGARATALTLRVVYLRLLIRPHGFVVEKARSRLLCGLQAQNSQNREVAASRALARRAGFDGPVAKAWDGAIRTVGSDAGLSETIEWSEWFKMRGRFCVETQVSCPRKRASRLGRTCCGPGFPPSRE